MTKQELINFADFQDEDEAWILIIRDTTEGKCLIRRNTGIQGLKLIGIAEYVKADVLRQLNEVPEPEK